MYLYSYHFIANSTSYVFERLWLLRQFFWTAVITRIESIGGGRVGGWWGEAGAGGKPKEGQSNRLDSSSSAVPSVLGPELL